MIRKRIFDIVVSASILLAIFPLLLFVSIWVKLDSRGPVIFRQQRVGKGGVPFVIFKFRTMRDVPDSGRPLITQTNDSRITRSGRLLRKWKLDELPQLFNVFIGQMSIVGPRPEVRRYVEQYSDEARRKILSVRPGITDNASIRFRNENKILAAASDIERVYVDEILPEKNSMNIEYVENWSLLDDFKIILCTVWVVLVR